MSLGNSDSYPLDDDDIDLNASGDGDGLGDEDLFGEDDTGKSYNFV